MFKMIEVIGTSEKGFSEAVQAAIAEVMSGGEKVHFFEVIEQRGAVREGKLKAFQVKLKVAVEAVPAADHVCPTCQQQTAAQGHLCVPVRAKDETCSWCGALIPDERHVCDEKIKELAYICNSCGRTAVKPDYLCNPKKIPSKSE